MGPVDFEEVRPDDDVPVQGFLAERALAEVMAERSRATAQKADRFRAVGLAEEVAAEALSADAVASDKPQVSVPGFARDAIGVVAPAVAVAAMSDVLNRARHRVVPPGPKGGASAVSGRGTAGGGYQFNAVIRPKVAQPVR